MRSRVKWSIVGDKCIMKFFLKMICQKNFAIIIYGLRDIHERKITKREDLDRICHDFHQNLYKQKDFFRESLSQGF